MILLGTGRGLAGTAELLLTCTDPIPGQISKIEILKTAEEGQPAIVVEESYTETNSRISTPLAWDQWWDLKKGGIPLSYKGEDAADQFTLIHARDGTWTLKKICTAKKKEEGCSADENTKACCLKGEEKPKAIRCTSMALNLGFKTAAGEETGPLSHLLADYDVVVFEVMNPKCPDCTAAAPVLKKVEAKFSETKQVVFLSLWTPWEGDTEETAKKYAADNDDSMLLFDATGNVRKDFGVTAIPTICVIRPDLTMPYCEVREGELQKKDPKGKALEQAIRAALKWAKANRN
ncbi:MAG: thioredoxin-like domain-containing protein [Pseudomonadota bacterium]